MISDGLGNNGGCQVQQGASHSMRRGITGGRRWLGKRTVGDIYKSINPYILWDKNKQVYGIKVSNSSGMEVTPMNREGGYHVGGIMVVDRF